jgi:hypothetical protein
MKRLALYLLLLIVPAVSAQEKLSIKEETPYFPLKEGSVWTYSISGRTFTKKVVGFEKSGDDVCARLEMRRGKDLVSSELMTVRKDGVYRVEFSGKKCTPPVCLLKLPIKKDETWKFDTKVGESETKGSFKLGEARSVKVKGTTYEAVTVTGDMKVDNQNATVTYYFAEKFGLVKYTLVLGTITVEQDLEKYEPK